MSTTPRLTGMSVWAVLLLVLTGCSSPAPMLPQAPASPQDSGQAMQAATAVPSPPASSPSCGDPLSRTPSASFGSQPGSIAVVRTYTPTINITRSDYEAALAKWNHLQVYEYEVDVENGALLGFFGTLHVTGDHVEATTPGHDGKPAIPVGIPEDYTVANLFHQLGLILTHGLCPSTGIWAFPVNYTVTFDSDKGYPTLIDRDAHQPPEWLQEGRYSSAPAHSSYSITLRNLKVIRTGVPGMPRSGHPGT